MKYLYYYNNSKYEYLGEYDTEEQYAQLIKDRFRQDVYYVEALIDDKLVSFTNKLRI